MKLWNKNGAFIFDCYYEERDVPKKAGFYFHGLNNCWANCKACESNVPKRWFTFDKAKATQLIQYADEPTKALLQGTAHTLAASEAVTRSDVQVPAPAGLEYLPFQKAGIAFGMERANALISDEPGLGKTIQALGIVNGDPTIQSVLVICPATLRINWLRESQKWMTRSFNFYVVETNDPIPQDANFIIINFDKLLNKTVQDSLAGRTFDLGVIDEAHKLKNPKTQRACAILGYYDKVSKTVIPGVIDSCRKKVFLTGTPILNRPVEIFPLINKLDPDTFKNWMWFVKRFCNGHETKYGWDVSGAANLEELQLKLRSTIMIRRLKADVLKELPPKRRQVVCLPGNGAKDLIKKETETWKRNQDNLTALRANVETAKASNEESYKDAVAKLRTGMSLAFSEISAARHQLAVAKVPHVVEFARDMLESGVEKIVIFAHHKDVICKLEEEFGDDCVALTGDTAMAIRDPIVQRFQSDPSIKVFIGSITAAGVGITLTAASHVLFAELDWVPANVSQAEDRCHRLTQENPVLVQHLVFDESLDASMAKALVEKQEIAKEALNNLAQSGTNFDDPISLAEQLLGK